MLRKRTTAVSRKQYKGVKHLSWEKTIGGKKYELKQVYFEKGDAEYRAHSEWASGYIKCKAIKGYQKKLPPEKGYQIRWGVYCRYQTDKEVERRGLDWE